MQVNVHIVRDASNVLLLLCRDFMYVFVLVQTIILPVCHYIICDLCGCMRAHLLPLFWALWLGLSVTEPALLDLDFECTYSQMDDSIVNSTRFSCTQRKVCLSLRIVVAFFIWVFSSVCIKWPENLQIIRKSASVAPLLPSLAEDTVCHPLWKESR